MKAPTLVLIPVSDPAISKPLSLKLVRTTIEPECKWAQIRATREVSGIKGKRDGSEAAIKVVPPHCKYLLTIAIA